jgi:hypothetical protein
MSDLTILMYLNSLMLVVSAVVNAVQLSQVVEVIKNAKRT